LNTDDRVKIIVGRRQRRQNQHGKGQKSIRIIAIVLVALVLSCGVFFSSTVGGAVALYLSFTADLPDPSQLAAKFTQQNTEFFETTKIYDRTGKNLLYEVIDPRAGDRQWVALESIPQFCRQAAIAIEDRSFYDNPGFDIRGMARAFLSNAQGGTVQGGSSITQQLVKNTLIDPSQRTIQSGIEGYTRKLKEVLLSAEIGRRYPKDQILEWYLNTNFYGNLAYGIQAASKIYFNKTVDRLNLAECSMLAAIPEFPSQNPIDNPADATSRQALVLDAMLRDNYISAEETVAAKTEKLNVIVGGVADRFDIVAPHFSVYVRKWLEDKFGADVVFRGGLKIYTTLDLDLQNHAQQAIADQVKQLTADDHNANNGAAVVIRPTTGEILAMVGSADYWNDAINGKFNVATGVRQPGSSFKPFTYLTLLSQGIPASYSFLDVRTEFQQPGANPPIYVPENYDRKYHGYARLRLALARSYNIPAVKAMEMAGVDNVIRTTHKMGITTLDRGLDFYGLALTLGGGEVKLLDETYAFGVFANEGKMAGSPVPEERQRPGYRTVDPVPVLRVEDSKGNVLWEYNSPTTIPILDPRLAYLMNSILSDNGARCAAFGCPNVLELKDRRPAAVKTGTTNDFKDNWTVGYTPQVVVGVWIGNTDNSSMKHVTGISGAAPVWNDIMEYFLNGKEKLPFIRPPGLVQKTVCATTGLLPTKYCPQTTEIFIPGTEPTAYDTLNQAFLIDIETGNLATTSTPPDKVEEKVYEIYPPEAADFVKEANIPQPPAQYDTNYGPSPNTYGDVAIIQPGSYSYIHGIYTIIGNAKGDDWNHYRLDFGKGLNPTEWQQIGPDHGEQIDQGPLENFDVTSLDGLFSLRLTAFRNNGDTQTSIVPVTVDNISPTIKIIYPSSGDGYEYGQDEWVNIQLDVQDNIAIDYVQLFVDDNPEPWSTHNAPPYGDKWLLNAADRLGTHTFFARVYDKASNVANSNKVTVRIGVKKP
jgi:membrane peptidoglycan carboxypeptidase